MRNHKRFGQILVAFFLAALVITVPAWAAQKSGSKTQTQPAQATSGDSTKVETPKPKAKKQKPQQAEEQPVRQAPSAPVVAPPSAPAPRPATRTVQPSPATTPASHGGGANNTALLVGINNAPGTPPVEGSITDVHNTKNALIKYGYKSENIKILTEGAASRGAILAALDSLAKRTSGNGLAVVQISTHATAGDSRFATGEGGRISRHELAAKLAQVRGKLWTNLAMCYSGAYNLPGIVGKNRIAVFSSKATEQSFQVGSAGSWMIMYMVKKGMLERNASSIEDAYHYAKNKLQQDAPDRTPIMSDGIEGNVKLPI